jgi:hypothetical protein
MIPMGTTLSDTRTKAAVPGAEYVSMAVMKVADPTPATFTVDVKLGTVKPGANGPTLAVSAVCVNVSSAPLKLDDPSVPDPVTVSV